MEKQLVTKTFYETLLIDKINPVQFLGEQLQTMDQDAAIIRFAQGEVYFHYKDYETAIFKWEMVGNDLKPWAKRNIADAYFELGLWQKAEEMYKAVITDNRTLNVEVGLQLFSLYHKQNMLDSAFAMIKICVSLNPDYPNVTLIARTFYEEQQDEKSALDLALNEAIRTLSHEWFSVLNHYIRDGYAKTISPEYFSDVLSLIYQIDQSQFEAIVSSLWQNYETQHELLPWLKMFNPLFAQIKIEQMDSWDVLVKLYEKTYHDLTKSCYMKELSEIMPSYLANWLKVADLHQEIFSSSAVLAWSEIFPKRFNQDVVDEAKVRICQSNQTLDYYSMRQMLLDEILDWAAQHDLNVESQNLEEERTNNLLLFIRKIIMNLLEKQVEAEKGLAKSIHWDEEMVEKLGGAIHQIHDLESEKTHSIINSFQELKETTKNDLKMNIPKLLQGCAELIKENSDFRQIHLVINEEMNNRLKNYLQETVLPTFYHSLTEWIAFSHEEFQQGNRFLEEMKESFNTMYGYERINYSCDFKVLDDWQRDADRMTSRVQIEKVNILLRRTPAQVLLKGAGKLFGSLSQNKSLLYNKYKGYIETENYQEVSDIITKKFIGQFELFEGGLERDISLFFRNSINVLSQTVEETNREIHENKEILIKMKENPELYQDPLNLFEVRLRQHELINNVIQKNSPYPFYDVMKQEGIIHKLKH